MKNVTKILKGTNPYIVLILLIPTVLNFIWFRSGNIMGVAESGLPFYNFQIAYNSNSAAWAYYALGFPTNINIASKPTYWFLARIQNAGVPGFILQAALFWLVLVISGFSIYAVTANLFPRLNKKYLLLAVLFYWFNPFSMVNVWNRFLNNFFVFYMFLPLAVYIFIKGLQTKRLFYALILGLVSIFFSYSFSSVAFTVLLWMILFLIALFYGIFYKNVNLRFFSVKFFLTALTCWVIINIWWISQSISYVYSGSFQAVEQTSFSPSNNQRIFTLLSEKLGNLVNILRFEHGSFFSKANDLVWVRLYTFPLISLLYFCIPVIIFLPIYLKKKNFSVIFLSSLLLIGIFLSQGNNPPFGQIFNVIFPKVAFLQAFRNAFEKFGFILPLAGAPLFAYGLYLIENFRFRIGRYIYLLIVSWVMGIMGIPFFTSWVFSNSEIPVNIPSSGYQVIVPKYYQEANQWLNSQNGNFRLLTFPLGGEGITYHWEKGYTGVELSNQLISVPAVSFQTNIPFYDDVSSDLENTFLKKNSFSKVTDILNTKYIMFRDDIDWHTRRMRDPQIIFNRIQELRQQGLLQLAKDFQGISFWQNPNWRDRSIYVTNQATSVFPLAKISDSQFLNVNNSVLIGGKTKLNDLATVQNVVHPVTRLSLEDNFDQTSAAGQDIFPHAKFFPTDKIYPLILFKEQLDTEGIVNISDKVDAIIKLLGKRLVETEMSTATKNMAAADIAIDGYRKQLNSMNLLLPEYILLNISSDKQLSSQEKYYRIFLKHKILIDEIIHKVQSDQQLINKLRQTQQLIDVILAKGKIMPVFGFKDTAKFPVRRRVDYEFDVPQSGDYELIWGNSNWDKYYKNPGSFLLQVDDHLVEKHGLIDNFDMQSFGQINLTKGIHNLAMNTPEEKNLIEAPAELELKVNHGITQRSFAINDYDPQAGYIISFDYLIKKGTGVKVFIKSNNSFIKLGDVIPDYYKSLGPDDYEFDVRHFSNSIKLTDTTDATTIYLQVQPWNDCEAIFHTNNKSRCNIPTFRSKYDRTTEVMVKNITVTRKLVDEPTLVKLDLPVTKPLPQMNFKKISNTYYQVNIKNANNPYILVLSELFDPGWEVFTDSGQRITKNHFLANSYANGWEIDKQGDYNLTIKFVPQDLLGPAEKISMLAFITATIIITVIIIRKKHA